MRQKAFFKKKKFGFFRCFRFSTLDWNARKFEFLFKVTGKYGRQNFEKLDFSSNKNKINKN